MIPGFKPFTKHLMSGPSGNQLFLRFWLAKITSIIHQNQSLWIKFGRIMPYWIDDVKSAAKLQITKQLTEKTWGRVWFLFEASNGRTFYWFHGEKLSKKNGKNNKKTTQRTTFAIWGIFCRPEQPFISCNSRKRCTIDMNLTSTEVSML